MLHITLKVKKKKRKKSKDINTLREGGGIGKEVIIIGPVNVIFKLSKTKSQ